MAKRKPKPAPKPRPKPKTARAKASAKRPPPRPPKPPKVAAAPPPPPPDPDRAAAYKRHKERNRAGQESKSAAGRDLKGKIPPVANPARRARALASLAAFYEYFPHRFSLPFSRDGIKVRDRLEDVTHNGGLVPVVMPRGSGKTSQVIVAALYAIFSGRRRFVVPIGSNAKKAKNLLRSVKTEIRSNPLLAADFPEICFPFAEIAGSPNRCAGQTHDGKPTGISWGTYEIIFPDIPGSPASNSTIVAASIRSADLRGLQFTRPSDGAVLRPDLVLLDDVQDEKIARNPDRVDEVMDIIDGTILGMAGPGELIAAVALLTVIEANDVADRLSNRKLSPLWAGEKFKLLYKFPDDMKSWEEYGHLRAESFRRGSKGEDATKFFADRLDQMSAGADVAWPERFNSDEISGLQYAMNLFLSKPDVFWREYQNEPRTRKALENQLALNEVLDRTNDLDRGKVPIWGSHVTAFIDVQQTLLFWLVAAWSDDFKGAVVDYGTWPEQDRRQFTLNDAPRPFASIEQLRGAGVEASIRYALETCVGDLRRRAWVRDGGGTAQIDRIVVDTGFQPDVIAEWARSTQHVASVMPSRGMGIGAKKKPLAEYIKKPGERYGFHWMIPQASETRGVKTLKIDVNFWKSFLVGRLRQKVGDPGSLSLFGKAGTDHRMLANHFVAELCRPQTDEISGRTVDEWEAKPGKPDNHWWDCMVGAVAAAAMLGATLGGQTTPKPQRQKFKSYAEWRESRFGRRTS